MSTEQAGHHPLSDRLLSTVWAVLIALTALSVVITRADLGAYKVWGALALACIKTALVVLFFMHLKYESLLLRGFLLMVVVTLAIFIGFTFFDVLYR